MNYKIRKKKGILCFAMILVASILNGCAKENENPISTEITENEGAFDYVQLGNYEDIEVKVCGLDVYVNERYVDIPYRDEGSGTELTIQYYYAQVNPDEPKANWVNPSDEEIAEMGIPDVLTWNDLKNYVLDKVNENDEITSFMRVGDAVMEEIIESSTYEEIPEEVISNCESIYEDYLEEMKTHYNEIGEIPVMEEGENSARKVLAAMAIAEEAGFDKDEFSYEEILKYLLNDVVQITEE